MFVCVLVNPYHPPNPHYVSLLVFMTIYLFCNAFSVYVTISNSGEGEKKAQQSGQGGWVKWAWLSAPINVRSHDTIIASPWKEPAQRGLFLLLFTWWHQSITNSNSSNSSFWYQIEETAIIYWCFKRNFSLLNFLQKLTLTYLLREKYIARW